MSPCEVCIWTEELYVLHYFRRTGITEDSGNQSRKREIQIKTRWLLHSVKLAQEGVNYTLSCTTEASWAVSSIYPLGTQVMIPPLSPAGFIFKEALHSTSNSVSGSPVEATKGRWKISMLLLISLACLHFLVCLFIYLFIYLSGISALLYFSSSAFFHYRLSSPDSFSAALVSGLLCCRINLLGKQESFLQVNENAVSVKKFTDHENPSLMGRIGLMTFVSFSPSFCCF